MGRGRALEEGGAKTGSGGGAVTHLPGTALVQGHTLVPLVHVVRVLAQQDAVEEQGPPADELLEAGQAQLQVYVVWEVGAEWRASAHGPGGYLQLTASP